jgi:hypothetical protein
MMNYCLGETELLLTTRLPQLRQQKEQTKKKYLAAVGAASSDGKVEFSFVEVLPKNSC